MFGVQHLWGTSFSRRKSPGDAGGAAARNKLAVIYGQSNGLGHGVAANMVYNGGSVTSAFSAVQLTDKNAGSFSNPPTFVTEARRALAPRALALTNYPAGTAGIELVLGRELATRTGDTWSIAKMCIDGSSLISAWNNPAYPTGGPALLTQFISFVQSAMTAAGVTDPNDVVLIWIQGEADTGQAYATYLSNYQAMLTTIRAAIGNCYAIAHRITNQNDLPGNVRAALESAVAVDAKASITYADDLPLADTAHYTDASIVTFGIRAADATIALMYNIPTVGPYWAGAGPITIATSTGGITPTMPLHLKDDVLVFAVSALGNNPYTLSTANGFQNLAIVHDNGNSLNARLQAWFVVADQTTMNANSGQMPAPVMADVASDDSKLGFVFKIRGCNISNPIDVVQTAALASGTAVSTPAVTTGGANRLVLGIAACRVDLAPPQFGAWSNGSLTRFTPHVNLESTAGAGYGFGIVAGLLAAQGSSGALTSTLANASTLAAATIAFQ